MREQRGFDLFRIGGAWLAAVERYGGCQISPHPHRELIAD